LVHLSGKGICVISGRGHIVLLIIPDYMAPDHLSSNEMEKWERFLDLAKGRISRMRQRLSAAHITAYSGFLFRNKIFHIQMHVRRKES
jgi:hypothetical protein